MCMRNRIKRGSRLQKHPVSLSKNVWSSFTRKYLFKDAKVSLEGWTSDRYWCSPVFVASRKRRWDTDDSCTIVKVTRQCNNLKYHSSNKMFPTSSDSRHRWCAKHSLSDVDDRKVDVWSPHCLIKGVGATVPPVECVDWCMCRLWH